jgi:hypothetical protein
MEFIRKNKWFWRIFAIILILAMLSTLVLPFLPGTGFY